MLFSPRIPTQKYPAQWNSETQKGSYSYRITGLNGDFPHSVVSSIIDANWSHLTGVARLSLLALLDHRNMFHWLVDLIMVRLNMLLGVLILLLLKRNQCVSCFTSVGVTPTCSLCDWKILIPWDNHRIIRVGRDYQSHLDKHCAKCKKFTTASFTYPQWTLLHVQKITKTFPGSLAKWLWSKLLLDHKMVISISLGKKRKAHEN